MQPVKMILAAALVAGGASWASAEDQGVIGSSNKTTKGDTAVHADHHDKKMADGKALKVEIKTDECLNMLASDSRLEVQASQYVQKNVDHEGVKALAMMIEKDHQDALKQIEQLAEKKGIKLKSGLNEVHKAMLDHMQQKKGAELASMYAFDQSGGHVKDVLAVTQVSQSAEDADLRALAAKLLPTLKAHLSEVLPLAEQIAGGSVSLR